MINNEKVRMKRANALDAVEQLLVFFERVNERHWPKYFQPIAKALSCGKDDDAIRLEKEIPKVNMGGLLDLYLCRESGHKTTNPDEDQRIFNRLTGAVGQTITNLRVYREYELDYPIVEI